MIDSHDAQPLAIILHEGSGGGYCLMIYFILKINVFPFCLHPSKNFVNLRKELWLVLGIGVQEQTDSGSGSLDKFNGFSQPVIFAVKNIMANSVSLKQFKILWECFRAFQKQNSLKQKCRQFILRVCFRKQIFLNFRYVQHFKTSK